MVKTGRIAFALALLLSIMLLGGCEYLQYREKMEFWRAEAEKYIALYEETRSLYEGALAEAEKYRGLYEQAVQENEKLRESLDRMYK